MKRAILGAGLAMFLGACAPAARPVTAPAAALETQAATLPPSLPASLAAGGAAAPGDRAHSLLLGAAACWFGGVWADALGEAPAPDRCSTTLDRAYGAADPVRLERLRAAESVEVAELGDRLSAVGKADGLDGPHVDAIVALLKSVADAEHETLTARRAAEKIKKDIAGERAPGKRPDDERAAVAPLGASSSLAALLRFDAGSLGPEARAIALMTAMDRTQIAKDLPKHLKVYALGGAYEVLFGVKPPEVPADATQPMKGGAWLAYITDVASAAGHPVPASAKSLVDRELMAWGGALEGLADRMRTEVSSIPASTELARVVTGTIRRLDTEYRASEAAVAPHP